MAAINFFTKNTAGTEFDLTSLGYGLGFFKTAFGTSVPVSEKSDVANITNSNGTYSGDQTQFVEWTHASSGKPYGSSSGMPLTYIPNSKAPLNVRFTHSSAVLVTNVKLRVYDRANIDNNPSGISVLAAEIMHPATGVQSGGSGGASWSTVQGSGSILSLTSNPGSGGSGGATSGTRHDWYVAMVASPSSVGSKTFAGYVSLEYL